MAVFLTLVTAILVPRVAVAGKTTVLASVEASLERCRTTVTQHRETLSTCTAAKAPSPCICLCPTCLPQEWPHRKKPPPCTTPAPPPGPRTAKPPPPPPPPTAPPPPPLPPLKVLPPYGDEHLPTLGPFPETMTPTTTTLLPPLPPPGKCINDGIYRTNGMYDYEKIGDGYCVDEGDLDISFKKRRELTKLNSRCMCKEACDAEPTCIGYSDFATGCRVYGKSFPTLVDRWTDLDSESSPRYAGKKIVKGDGTKGQTCYKRIPAKTALVQTHSFVDAMPVPPPQLPEEVPEVSLVVRETSTSETLVWQREQLSRCRDQQAHLLLLLQQKGCSASSSSLKLKGRASANIMPNECECHCPDCNFWQLPPPVCEEPTPAPTKPPPPPPSNIIVVTGPPGAQTPPPMPVMIPLPPLPPIGNQFLPTLGPLPPPSML